MKYIAEDGTIHPDVHTTIVNAIRAHSSPTRDSSDAHGAKGQPGYILYENHLRFVVGDILRALDEMSDTSVKS